LNKKFEELRTKMSPERHARISAMAKKLSDEIKAAETREKIPPPQGH